MKIVLMASDVQKMIQDVYIIYILDVYINDIDI